MTHGGLPMGLKIRRGKRVSQRERELGKFIVLIINYSNKRIEAK